ncbi:MAG: CRISPR-associated helicase Cas3' [Anaerolineae bacterium]
MRDTSSNDQQNQFLNRIVRCWGKSGATVEQFHPALYHMLDVGHVAQQLLDEGTSPRWNHALARVLDVSPTALRGWIPWLVALHDIGKISAAFQGALDEQRQRLQQEGFSFVPLKNPGILHTHIGQACIKRLHTEIFPVHNLDTQLGQICAWMVGGHHGHYLDRDSLKKTEGFLEYEPCEWGELRQITANLLYKLLVDETIRLSIGPRQHRTATALLLTGFAILSDWLASDTRHFPLCADVPLETYITWSRQRAREAVQAAGFSQRTLSAQSSRFAVLFPAHTPPRPLQAAIDQLPEEILSTPCLAIIEAPTGEGKTEAALALAHRIACAVQGTDEMYYALPTTATSNQMFRRIQRYLNEHLNLPAQVKLVHGQAYLTEDDLRVELSSEVDLEERCALLEWFAPLKRSLLAPFGVGTVDQVELAALNVKHGMLRLIGLANKVVILDEVHAYDIYMTCVVERLLSWLSVLGSSVILLSATLPIHQRNQLARAYGCELRQLEALGNAYPSIYIGNRCKGYAVPIAASIPERRIALEWLHLRDQEDTVAKARHLLQLVSEGGCACWITNTVARAQHIFRALTSLAPKDVHCTLLHAQYPLEERQQREQEIARQYGKEGERPQRGIVVGTQVLEQSLDLDFDVMVSDLAPIDLILQRAGRLHRHTRSRPAAHPQPKMYLNAPLATPDDPDLETDKHIYAEYYMIRTWQLLRACPSITLPQDYRPLIEAVYGGEEIRHEEGARLAEAWEELQKYQQLAVGEAQIRLLPPPENPEDLLCSQIATQWLFKEDGNGTAWIVARTRLGEESITVIPLELDTDDLSTAKHARVSAHEEWLPLDSPASRETQLRLLRRSLGVSRKDAVQSLKKEFSRSSVRPLFRESPLLRKCVPLWLYRGCAHIEELTFQLDPELGLVIEKQRGV